MQCTGMYMYKRQLGYHLSCIAPFKVMKLLENLQKLHDELTFMMKLLEYPMLIYLILQVGLLKCSKFLYWTWRKNCRFIAVGNDKLSPSAIVVHSSNNVITYIESKKIKSREAYESAKNQLLDECRQKNSINCTVVFESQKKVNGDYSVVNPK